MIQSWQQRLAAAVIAIVVPSAHGDDFSRLTHSLLTQSPGRVALSDADIGAGLREALAKGTRTAVNQLGRTDGFWADPRVRIPLPGPAAQAEGVLRQAGMGQSLEQLHVAFNRAAEQAVPVAADVFAEAVRKLTLEDVRGILNGPQDAATQYFRRTTSDTLAARFKPIVAGVTARVGLARQYDSLMASAGPLVSMFGAPPDLDSYVTGKALDGLFLRVADEEKAIRNNPAARTTDLLRKVFGGK
jgi:hypothetical protein